MSRLSRAEIDHLAKLAKIGLTEDEADRLTAELSGIVDFVETLQKVDTTGVTPTNQVTGLTNIMRLDEVHVWADRERLLVGAPLTPDGHIKVPRVLE